MIRTILGGYQSQPQEEEEGEGEEEVEGSGSLSLDIRPDSFLDVVLNIIPNTVAGITGYNDEEEDRG